MFVFVRLERVNMSQWSQVGRPRACAGSSQHTVRLTVTRFTWSAGHDTITYDDLLGIDELVLAGAPANNTTLTMPLDGALLELFRSPQIGDAYAITVVNLSSYSFDLVAQTQVLTIGANALSRLWFRVVALVPASVDLYQDLVGLSTFVSPQLGADVPGAHAADIQVLTQQRRAASFQITQLLQQLSGGATVPAINPGRTITFTNNSVSGTPLTLYMTVGNPWATIVPVATLARLGAYVFPIPAIIGWNGNFTVWPTALTTAVGFNPSLGTLVEFGLNQFWSFPGVLQLRDTYDISTVPPGLGSALANGPHSACTQLSISAGYPAQIAAGYSVGVSITPPTNAPAAPDFLPQPVATTCVTLSGSAAQAVTFPNDTAVPKQQTGYAAGNYAVSFVDPMATSLA